MIIAIQGYSVNNTIDIYPEIRAATPGPVRKSQARGGEGAGKRGRAVRETVLKKGVIPKREEMVRLIRAQVRATERVELLPFDQALGRVCAGDVLSRNTLPNQPVSCFDGIAVRYGDFAAGPPDTSAWQEGREYAYGNTGIAMPAGYDTMIAIEDVTVNKTGIALGRQPAFPGEMVHSIGAYLQQGERLIAKGQVIVPAHIGLLAAGGVTEVTVFAKPRVGIIPTGDELVSPTDNLPLGKNIDSNSPMIAAYVAGWGGVPRPYPVVGDEPTAIAAALAQALAENDAAVIIAGSSLGTKDYTIRVLAEMGEVIVPQLAHGPGRKSSLSLIEGKPVLGVAGPPLGAQIVCDLYLAPFVSALRGLPAVEMPTLAVIADDPFPARQADFCERVHIYQAGDGYHIRSVFAPKTSRGQMQALANGNFYRAAGTACAPGDLTRVELLCPIEYLPAQDLFTEILGEDVEPYD